MDTAEVLKMFLAIIAFIMAQTGTVWWRIGKLEGLIKRSGCPFGECPVFERAKKEAMPERENETALDQGGKI